MRFLLAASAAYALAAYLSPVSWYQVSTALSALSELSAIPAADVEACLDAYAYLSANSRTPLETNTAEETENVRRYYSVVQAVLAIADIEKMYIPPESSTSAGVFGNQILLERQMIRSLNATSSSRLLDIGCGRGRVAHHVAMETGCRVSGFNVDSRQVEHARARATESGAEDSLDFTQGDFHHRFPYGDGSFDGAESSLSADRAVLTWYQDTGER